MRKHSRLTFRQVSRIHVFNRISGDPMGHIGDLSFGGLRLITQFPLAIGGCFDMRLEVPVREGHFRTIEITAICQWSRKDSRTGRFDLGFALDRPSAAFADLVNSLRASLGFARGLRS